MHDTQSGHATGGVVFVDWPEWRGHAGKEEAKASSMLSFALDKRNYEAGETATVYLPKSEGGRVLLSIENASKVISRRWVSTSADRETACKIPVTREMAPNFYVHATLLQPHAKSNDLPIRMYGVEGAEVIDRYSILHPGIEVADEIRPQQEFTIKVWERDRKPMTYTLAIVDEGLLDITAFKTPQPWRAMNRREALGVRTWDLYDDIIGAYAGKSTKILSVGGDEALRRAAGKEKRFNPVVKFLGPFTLRSGQRTHKITLPMYVGSVRVMVVAAHEATYGHADKTVAVRSPLMVLPTLPRILACGDRVKLPVNVFCMDEQLRNATVKVSAEGPVSVAGSASKRLAFAAPSEQLTTFDLVCDNVRSGRAKITVSADGGGDTASETIYIAVRNPLPPVITTYAKTLRPGEKYDFAWTPFSHGTAQLEVAAMPKIDFSGAFAFVDSYGHYCTEQLSARAMYLLYAYRFLSATEQAQAREALPKILKMILSRQTSDGGFAYWPGSEVNEWATSMAGKVMMEARRQGFAVADRYIERWREYQQRRARAYRHSHEHGEDLVQAYRLYTLVKAGDEPVAAMNRLRESRVISYQALMRLAAAYACAGKVEVARQLLGRIDNSVMAAGAWVTFQSRLRDQAMELETWLLAEQNDRALKLAREVAAEFSASNCTTQEVAFVSAAMNRLAGIFGDAATEVVIRPKRGQGGLASGDKGYLHYGRRSEQRCRPRRKQRKSGGVSLADDPPLSAGNRATARRCQRYCIRYPLHRRQRQGGQPRKACAGRRILCRDYRPQGDEGDPVAGADLRHPLRLGDLERTHGERPHFRIGRLHRYPGRPHQLVFQSGCWTKPHLHSTSARRLLRPLPDAADGMRRYVRHLVPRRIDLAIRRSGEMRRTVKYAAVTAAGILLLLWLFCLRATCLRTRPIRLS